MPKVIWYILISVALLGVAWVSVGFGEVRGKPTTKEQLGERLFFEKMLSRNNTISCASCHLPAYIGRAHD